MTIAINPSWCGNTPAHEFETIEDAVKHIKNNPSYEYLQNKRVRPYGDIDHYVPEDVDEYVFDILNTCVWKLLNDHFKSVNRKVALYSASSFTHRKISWRWVVPDVYVDSYKHAKEFAKVIYEQIDFKQFDIEPDMSVYASNKKMRMVGTSKPNENRPLVCDGCELVDTIITYIPPEAEHIPLDIPAPVEHTPVECNIDDGELKATLDCISVNTWTKYETCRNLIWAMRSCGVDASTIHAYCSKASNYQTKWVDDLIKSHNPSMSPTLTYIKKYARQDNPVDYAQVIFKNGSSSQEIVQQNIAELLTLTTDSTTKYDTGRYMADITDDPTQGIKGMMGLGKTTAMKKHIKKHLKSRILILSARRTFSDKIFSELKEYGFVHYEKEKQKNGRKADIEADKLIIQLSPASFKLIETQKYDIVYCDESETLLSMLSPLNIYKNTCDYVSMYKTFERIITDAKQVICMDAFLTDRTMNVLHSLRGKSQIIINETMPYNKTYVEIKGEQAFMNHLKDVVIRKNKRLVSIWGTAKAGQQFHNVLDHSDIKNQFYHKKSDEKIKAEHMSDVDKHWAEQQCVGYTGTISVGINYTNPDYKFNQLSLYASAWGPSARDYAQALHRAREITDNEVIVHISPSIKPCSSEAGFVNQVDMWDRELARTKDCLDALGEKYDDYATLPEWLKHLILWNRNEVVVNRRHLPELMREYLKLCGMKNSEVVESDEKQSKTKTEIINVEDVRIICDEEAEYLTCNRKCMSIDDHYALERYYMSNKVGVVDQFIWEMWIKNKSVVENAWFVVHSNPSELLNRNNGKVIELVSKNVPRLKFMQELTYDWTKSWELPVSDVEHKDLSAFSLRKWTDKDTPEQHCRELARCINNWCGYAVQVNRKRVKKSGVCDYTYTMVYDFEKSVAKYIQPKFKFEE
jgi:hypothetical protein